MLGRVAYGQTQYAQSGTEVVSKSELFQETLEVLGSRSFLTKKTLIGLLEISEAFNPRVFFTKVFVEIVSIVDSLSKFTSKGLEELLTVVDSGKTSIVKAFVDLLELVEDFSPRVFIAKSFVELLSIVDNLSKFTSKGLQEFLTVVDSAKTSIGKILVDLLEVVEDFSSTTLRIKVFVDNILVSLVSTISLEKVFSESITILEDFAKRLKGVVLKEYLEVQQSLVRVTSKVFADLIGLSDTLKKWLNGFFIRWTKRPVVSTEWTKTESSDTEWEKKTIRTIED